MIADAETFYKCRAGQGPKGENCDEYPFASSVQGQTSTAVTSKQSVLMVFQHLLTPPHDRMCASPSEQQYVSNLLYAFQETADIGH